MNKLSIIYNECIVTYADSNHRTLSHSYPKRYKVYYKLQLGDDMITAINESYSIGGRLRYREVVDMVLFYNSEIPTSYANRKLVSIKHLQVFCNHHNTKDIDDIIIDYGYISWGKTHMCDTLDELYEEFRIEPHSAVALDYVYHTLKDTRDKKIALLNSKHDEHLIRTLCREIIADKT